MQTLGKAVKAVSGATCIGAAGIGVFAFSLRSQPKKSKAEDILKQGHKFVNLPDGRKLEYCVIGDKSNPAAHTVYFQHGDWMSCQVMFLDHVCRSQNVKLIAASMPGFGYSDSYPLGTRRWLKEWPADVRAVLNNEQVNGKCHLWSVSIGCVHAAALAHPEFGLESFNGSPSGTSNTIHIGNVVFDSPTSCPEARPDDLVEGGNFMAKIFTTPYIGELLAYLIASQVKKEKKPGGISDSLSKAYDKCLDEYPGWMNDFQQSTSYAVVHTYRGGCDNAWQRLEPFNAWLKDLSAITGKCAIAIVSAKDDTANQPSMQKWFADEIKGSTLIELEPGYDHLHMLHEPYMVAMVKFLKEGYWRV